MKKFLTTGAIRVVTMALLWAAVGGCAPSTHHAPATPPQPAPVSTTGAPPTAVEPTSSPPVASPPSVPAASATTAPSPALPPPATAGLKFAELVPGVRVDREARVVEFDGTVPVDCHDPQTPLVFLEVLCCTPDTREHEALVVTKVAPSNIHAALLLVGLEAGAPGMLDFRGKELKVVSPTGHPLTLEFVWRGADGVEHVDTPSDWIVNVKNQSAFPATIDNASAWKFAGSRMVSRRDRASGQIREVDDADGAGTVIGLTTFGSEVVAFARVLSPEEAITPAEWIANTKRVPTVKTPVKVRIRAGN